MKTWKKVLLWIAGIYTAVAVLGAIGLLLVRLVAPAEFARLTAPDPVPPAQNIPVAPAAPPKPAIVHPGIHLTYDEVTHSIAQYFDMKEGA